MSTATMERTTAQTEYATITVQFVNEKKAGARNASIKDIDGAYYWVKPEMLQTFQPGGVYEISFTTSQSNGYTNRTIKSAEAQQQEPARPAPRAQAAQARPAAVRQSAPVEPPPHQDPPRQQSNGNGGQYYRPTSPKDARRMFVCSQLNAIITSRQVTLNAQAIADTIAMLTDAYDATIGVEDQ